MHSTDVGFSFEFKLEYLKGTVVFQGRERKVEKKSKTTILNSWKPLNFPKKFSLEKVVFLYLVDSNPQVNFLRKKTRKINKKNKGRKEIENVNFHC
jgi:hypothetical protein